MAISKELEKMYYDDKKERETVTHNPRQLLDLEENARNRIKRLKELLPCIDLNEIWNCHYIAYLLQHGETTEDFRLAHEYAKKAVDMGSNVTKWLYAATLDRYLVSQGKKQKFGTQFRESDGKTEMLPIDGAISDEERKEYGIPPLSKALEAFNKKHNSYF